MTRGDSVFDSTDWRDLVQPLGVALLLVVVVPFVLYAIPQLVLATNSYVVVSDSMRAPPGPVLQTGDVVFVYDTPPDRIEEGDVITYRSGNGQVTTHRVVDVRRTDGDVEFKTKGDANEEPDAGTVRAASVVGTVGFSLPYIGHVITFAGTTYGIVLLLIVPAALLILNELWVSIRTINTRSQETVETNREER